MTHPDGSWALIYDGIVHERYTDGKEAAEAFDGIMSALRKAGMLASIELVHVIKRDRTFRG